MSTNTLSLRDILVAQARLRSNNSHNSQLSKSASLTDQLESLADDAGDDDGFFDAPDVEIETPDGEKTFRMRDVERKIKKRKFLDVTDDELHAVWNQHKKTPDDDHTARNMIVKTLKGYTIAAVDPYRRGGAPVGALRLKAYEDLVKGIESWDPSHDSGAPLRSWTAKSLNLGGGSSSVSEAAQKFMGTKKIKGKWRWQNATALRQFMDEFKQKRNRMPSAQEIQDEFGIDRREARKVLREMSATKFTDALIDTDQSFDDVPPAAMDAIKAVYYSTNGRRQKIMEKEFWDVLGHDEPESDADKDKAKEIGIGPSTYSREKSTIIRRIKDLM